jgi:hypothetical protein
VFFVQEVYVAQNALADPKVIVTLLMYTSAARMALAHFPPLWFPKKKDQEVEKINWDGLYVDGLRYHVLMLLLARITRTYAYATKVDEYSIKVFLLELGIAFFLAAQFRILDVLEKPDEHRWSLATFYGLQLLIFSSTFLWGVWASECMPALRMLTTLFRSYPHNRASVIGWWNSG